jgi:3-deoxy-D-manno-octulosonic-acid transferase
MNSSSSINNAGDHNGLLSRALWKIYDFSMTFYVRYLYRPFWQILNGSKEADLVKFNERMGVLKKIDQPIDLIIHAASAGEMRAVESLLVQIEAISSDLSIILTTMTHKGLMRARALHDKASQVKEVVWMPFDCRTIILPWLKQLSPKGVVVIEAELWPNLFISCKQLGIPIAIASARLYCGDVQRYRLIYPLIKHVLDCAVGVWAQDSTEASRYLRIGASPQKIKILGNLKFSYAWACPDNSTHRQLMIDPVFGAVIMAGCTYQKENQWIINAFHVIKNKFENTRLILAPMEYWSCGILLNKLKRMGYDVELFSGRTLNQKWDVLIVDKVGYLASLYKSSDIVFVGGSLVPRGGHNFVEAALARKPVVVGPYTDNFSGVVARFKAKRGIIQIQKPSSLLPTLMALLSDPDTANHYGCQAWFSAEQEISLVYNYGAEVQKMLLGRR